MLFFFGHNNHGAVEKQTQVMYLVVDVLVHYQLLRFDFIASAGDVQVSEQVRERVEEQADQGTSANVIGLYFLNKHSVGMKYMPELPEGEGAICSFTQSFLNSLSELVQRE
jgi:hypothetical protein